MRRQVKLVALDLDGTLLDRKNRLSERSCRVVKEVQSRGIMVTLATGRMFCSALPFARELGIKLPLVTYQGALVKEPESDKPVYHRLVPRGAASMVVDRAQKYGYPVNIYHEDRLFVENLTPETKAYVQMAGVEANIIGDLLDFLNFIDPIKVLVIQPEEALDRLEEELRQAFGTSLYITKSQLNFLEILHPEATKGLGLKAVASFLGIPKEEIMVVGDSYNDIEMFRYAGVSVAMGNAREAVCREADFITASNQEDGVALALERLLLEENWDWNQRKMRPSAPTGVY